ncbi:MAG: hypothetical protein A2046_11615 [Bacteroidetes bacterium GWA2_30_7]|nr:MAG: hypothetical protein A2046_11615 [Bacteroidetes bacterium GWA2_30_7]
MKSVDEFYKPTNFWDNGLISILNDLKTDADFKNFRSHKSARYMYVPTYEHSLYKKHKGLINKIFKVNHANKPIPSVEGFFGTLSGYNNSKSDYRVYLATNKSSHPNVTNVSESLIGNPIEYYSFDNKNFSKPFLNYLLGINFLKNNFSTDNVHNVFELGGGYGTLGEILLKSSSDIFYLNIDIPPVAAVSTYYLSEVFGKETVLTYDQSRNLEEINIEEIRKKYKCVVLCPWQLPKIKGSFELFVNFMSFQEMEPKIVKNYINYVEKLTTDFVLLRNSKFGKRIANEENNVGVKEPTTTDMMYSMFEKFSLAGRDSTVYGQKGQKFDSEIACLSRNK